MRRKKLKLQNLDIELRSQSSHSPPIFKGIVAHVNGYTQPSLKDLHTLIVSHGGGFLQYLDGKTAATHVIASNLTPKKKVEFARYRIVKPAWVVDSVNAGKVLPWDAYRLVDEGVTQKILGFDNGRVVSQSNTQQMGYREQTETSWYMSQMRKNAEEMAKPPTSTEGKEVELEHVTPFPSEQAQVLPASELSPAEDNSIAAPSSSTRKDLRFLADEIEMEDDAFGTEQGLATGEVEPISQQPFSAVANEHVISGNVSSPPINARQTSLESDVQTPDGPEEQIAVPENETSRLSESSEARPSPQNPATASPERRKLTAEEHNARLLSDPHIAKSSTANPDFLNQYYRESRLHHLSTWKSELKAQLQSLANEQTSSQKSRQKRCPGARRYIIHVDFDSFFAAVSLRKHPDLVDKPVVIAHGSGPASEIASCNYPARKFGVKNGMWMKYALQVCPDLKTLPYDFKAYEEASRLFYKAIIATDGIVQSVSIDEALVDISNQCIAVGGSDGKGTSEESIYREQAKADAIASDLRALIKEKTGCAVSVGIGNNILLAKVALRKAKPAGQHQIKPEEALDLVGELLVQDLPGVAYSLGGKLEDVGVRFVKDIRGLTRERLINALGPKTGERLWDYSRGIDNTEVGDQVVRKSVSAEINWGIRFVTQEQADDFVQCLCDELSRRLLEQGFKGRQMTMKIMRRAADAPLDPPKNLGHGKCDTFNKSVILGVATNDKSVLGKEALSILKAFGFSPGELRGLGVQMQKLEPLKPSGNLFSPKIESSQRRLQFKPPSTISQNLQNPSAAESSKSPAPSALFKKPTKGQDYPDLIERSPTPEDNSGPEPIKGALASARAEASEAIYKPLNITGTQFVLPTQIDPSVLAELPSDIRSRLAPKQKRIVDTFTKSQSPSPPRSRSQSPFPSIADLPNQSQLDPDTLNALPEDVRDELLSYYQSEASRSNSCRHHQQQQQLLPQSPRKPRPVVPSKKPTSTPTKKHKTSTLLGRGRPPKATSRFSTTSTLTQSNFVANQNIYNKETRTTRTDTPSGTPSDPQLERSPPPPEVSESFLSALPPDLRREILDQQKRDRLRQRSGLDITNRKRPYQHHNPQSDRHSATSGGHQQQGQPAQPAQRKLILPPRPEMPTFTSRKLSSIEELRDAMGRWVEEFSTSISSSSATTASAMKDGSEEGEAAAAEGEEPGPYDEDVDALAAYLEKVVSIERNMDKAVSVVKWLEWLVGELPRQGKKGQREVWGRVVERLKEVVRGAVVGRSGNGLGVVDFG